MPQGVRRGASFDSRKSKQLPCTADEMSEGHKLPHIKTLSLLVTVGLALGPYVSTVAAVGSPYAPGSDLVTSLGCPRSDSVSDDPVLSIGLSNKGTSPVAVPDFPIYVLVNLFVKDAAGDTVKRGKLRGETRSMGNTRFLQPGATVMLDDFISMDRPKSTAMPLSLFGYHLTSGTYFITVSPLIDEPQAPLSNTCVVIVN